MVDMLIPSQDPYKFGAWSVTVNLPVIPISAALLPNGNIIAWSSDEPNDFETDIGHEPSNKLATLFNPITGQVSPLLDTGLAADMNFPRVYNGSVTLSNGNVFTSGGAWSGGPLKNGELWVPGRGGQDTGIAPLVADDP